MTDPRPSFSPSVPGDAGAVHAKCSPSPGPSPKKPLSYQRPTPFAALFPTKALLCSKLGCGKPQKKKKKSLLGGLAFPLPVCPCRIWPLMLSEQFRVVWCQECCQSKFPLSEQERAVSSRGQMDGWMDALVLLQLFHLPLRNRLFPSCQIGLTSYGRAGLK